ncbi:hypothetical protein SKAU_G00401730 [Synaphobranchus kaupii]|uniref:Uncharacterized protein n=1 Tax=Synaphobranchus kaupii TaxID=118154 RepID=A0A9Q1E951_SYNKA|nr:hypothetical protein SKAU_G00401730 [Synaphobranchus kaupii]
MKRGVQTAHKNFVAGNIGRACLKARDEVLSGFTRVSLRKGLERATLPLPFSVSASLFPSTAALGVPLLSPRGPGFPSSTSQKRDERFPFTRAPQQSTGTDPALPSRGRSYLSFSRLLSASEPFPRDFPNPFFFPPQGSDITTAVLSHMIKPLALEARLQRAGCHRAAARGGGGTSPALSGVRFKLASLSRTPLRPLLCSYIM